MKKEKIIALIKSVILALITVFGFVGLSEYVPLLNEVLEKLDGIVSASFQLIAFVTMIIAYFKPAENAEIGKIIRDKHTKEINQIHLQQYKKDIFDYSKQL